MSDTKLWNTFSTYIRLRDANSAGYCDCITCGTQYHWKKMHAGHGIGRQHKSVKFNEQNVHAQCVKCNAFNAGEQARYKDEVNKRYGSDTWNKLEIASRQTCKRGKFEIETMTSYYKEQVKKLKLEKGL